MSSLRGNLKFRNNDSSKDLNEKFASLVTKGVFDSGSTHASGATGVTTPVVSRVPGQLSVQVGPFAAVCADGMMVVHDAPPNKILAVTANMTQYILVRAVYNGSGEPDIDWEVLSAAEYSALITSEKQKRIILAKVSPPLAAVEVQDQYIDLRENDIVDRSARSMFRGFVAAVANLPTDSPTAVKRVKDGDVYLVLDAGFGTGQFYRWSQSGASWQSITDGALLIDFTQHVDGTDDPAHQATKVGFAAYPARGLSSTRVQAAIEELANEAVLRAGDTMSGALTVTATGTAITANGSLIGTQASGTLNGATGAKGLGGAAPGGSFGGPGVWGVGGAGASGASTTGGSGIVGQGGAGGYGGAGIDATGGATLDAGTADHSGGPGVYATGGATAVANTFAGHGVEARGGNAAGASSNAGHGLKATGGNAGGASARDGHGVLAQAGAGGAVKATGVVALGPGASTTIPVAGENAGAYAAGGSSGGSGVVGAGGSTNGTGVVGTGGSSNGVGVAGTGAGTGAGVTGTGGGSAGAGVIATGGAGGGVGLQATGNAAGSGVTATGGGTAGTGLVATGGAGGGVGLQATGNGAGSGVVGTGGATDGWGVVGTGGGTNGIGVVGNGGGTGPGVRGTGSSGSSGVGVEGIANQGKAVYGHVDNSAGQAGYFENTTSGVSGLTGVGEALRAKGNMVWEGPHHITVVRKTSATDADLAFSATTDTYVNVPFADTPVHQKGITIAGSNDRFVISRSGLYLVSYAIPVHRNAGSNATVGARIIINGGAGQQFPQSFTRTIIDAAAHEAVLLSHTFYAQFTAGNEVILQVVEYEGAGSALAILNANNGAGAEDFVSFSIMQMPHLS